MGYDCAMMEFSPYGPYWHEVRKIAIVELLSNARLDALAHVRRAEVDESIKALRARCAQGGANSLATVEMKRWLGELIFNAVVKMFAGRRCFESTRNGDADVLGRFRKAAADWFVLFGEFVPLDVLPIFKWVYLKGYKAAMRRTAEEIDMVLVGWLEEHRNNRAGGGKVEGDFMDAMLSIIDKAELSMYDPYMIIKATSTAMILGGTDKTTLSLKRAIALLINDCRVLKKAQEGLDIHVGPDRNVDESDINSLTYLHAIVKEVMRLDPAVMVNVWKIQHDPLVWPDPVAFRPERFVGSNLDVRGQLTALRAVAIRGREEIVPGHIVRAVDDEPGTGTVDTRIRHGDVSSGAGRLRRRNINHHKTPPEPSRAWPIIGHLPLLSRPGLCRTLAALADKHRPVFSLRLGVRCTVVVISLAEAKECFTSNDLALAGRPDSAAACIMSYDCAMIGFSPYGPYLREVRKIAIVELLSNARLDALAHVRRAEVDKSVAQGTHVQYGARSAEGPLRQWSRCDRGSGNSRSTRSSRWSWGGGASRARGTTTRTCQGGSARRRLTCSCS
ncbi:Cytochrome P450 82C4 [Acorus calamus]|uniref:Cytochrome P450 82C4 n=1 Tax=Acorus calamus TaxID=4465 RepID=A0AAV9ESW9_ACOCL|nr:Cytochrome P450 82C4 [Acorus calamus]